MRLWSLFDAAPLSRAMLKINEEIADGLREELITMSKSATQVHVIADETLGGIKREYVEVEGDVTCGQNVVFRGRIYEITYVGHGCVSLDGRIHLPTKDVTPLEPTDIVIIDGKRFRMVDRKADVGERILYYYEGISDGLIIDVLDVFADEVEVDYEDAVGDTVVGIDHGAYLVLEPVANEASLHSNDDIIANLVRRVAELERDIGILNVIRERQVGIDRHIRKDISGIKRDVETWAQEVEELKHVSAEAAKPQQITIDADVFARMIGGVK